MFLRQQSRTIIYYTFKIGNESVAKTRTDAINLAKFCYFVIVARFEVVTSSGPYNDFFWTLSSNISQYSTEMKTQFPDTEN